MDRWPKIVYSEEVMRERFGIERGDIPIADKVALLDALADAGLRRISVGAFVNPRFVPQMASFEELLRSFEPRPGVAYLTFLHNEKARAKALRFSPPLTVEDEVCTLFLDICDVHQRRNVNLSIEQAMATWPDVVAGARSRGVTTARVGIASAWGSNFLGPFSRAYRMASLARQVDFLRTAGLRVIEIGLHDSQSFCLPHDMEADLLEIRRRWPEVKQFHLHMHDARGMALPSIYAALRTLDESHTLLLDGTLGGAGGGQYCGNGAASGMAATEDLLHMLEGMGIPTGVDLRRLIECAWLLERTTGQPTHGHVSQAGPRPTDPAQFYDPNLPAVESLRAARHFMLGPGAYEGEAYSPWRQPIAGPWYPGSKERNVPDPSTGT
jgi:hydroxymethylglutaryl-CoA lyase